MNHAQQEMKELAWAASAGRPEPPTCPCRDCLKKWGYQLDRVEENYYHNPEESAYKYLLQF